MSSTRTFRKFLEDAREKLFPAGEAEILSPTSPPQWNRLGWKVGWIVKEAHTGLQFWLTEEHHWDQLTRDFGRNPRQKNQVFIDWYSEYLSELRSDLGVPLELENLRWRQMDITEFEDRPLIDQEDWWEVEFEHSRYGSWTLILPQKFVNFFEEDVDSSESTEPPWDFLELWDQISPAMKEELIQELGREDGLRNHLVSLVLSTDLTQSEVQKHLPRTPGEEFTNTLQNREQAIESMTRRQRDQTLDRWREDALSYLTKQVGEWLEQGELGGSKWKALKEEWANYKMDKLSDVFDTDSWIDLWSGLSERDLRQVVPRLDSNQLRESLEQLPRKSRNRVLEESPGDHRTSNEDQSRSTHSKREVMEARRSIFREGREIIRGMDYELDGEWTVSGESED